MSRYRSNFFALALICVALVMAASVHASSLPARHDFRDGDVVTASATRVASSRDDEHAVRLARAYRELLAAEQSVQVSPAAAATFGPMLREARARFEAGLEAAAQTSVFNHLPMRALLGDPEAPFLPSDLHAASDAPDADRPDAAPSDLAEGDLRPRHRAHLTHLIWA